MIDHVRQGAAHVEPLKQSARPPADPNTRATVALVSHGAFDLLLSADAESPALLPLALPRVDAMKVGKTYMVLDDIDDFCSITGSESGYPCLSMSLKIRSNGRA